MNKSNQILLAVYEKNSQEINVLRQKFPGFYSLLSQLKKNGFIIRDKNGKYQVTSKGTIKVHRIKWATLKLDKKKNNQGYIVVFDVPETDSRKRDLFRQCLYELGFSRIQKSVFLSEYEVLGELKRLIKNIGLKKCVEVFKVTPESL